MALRPNPTFEALGWTLQPFDNDLARVTLLGRYPVKVRPELAEAVTAMNEALMVTGYENPCDWVGSWFYRDIAGTNGLASSHAYAVAIDLDYGGDNPDSPDHGALIDRNPHIHRRIVPGDPGFGVEWQILEHQVRAVENIRNEDGAPIWSWRIGWVLGDTMHWQPLVGPADCQVDWTTVPTIEPTEPTEPEPEEPEMTYETLRSDEFDLWTDENILDAYDAGMFEDTNRLGFADYWVVKRAERTSAEKARFMTDYYAHLWKRN